MKVISVAVAACFAVCGTSVFAGSIDATGVGKGSVQNEVIPVSEGLVVVHSNTTYEGFDGVGADNPLADATGKCWGSIMIKAGAVSGGGLCNYTDGDGDTAIMGWSPEGVTQDGRTTGSWSVEGGTGKWAAATGGGAFDSGMTDGVYSNKITGEFILP
jgi:hypothetical protein